MAVSRQRLDALLVSFPVGSPRQLALTHAESQKQLAKLLNQSSARLLDFPNQLLVEIIDSAAYHDADYIEIVEIVKEEGVFNGQVKMMRRVYYRRTLSKVLCWLGVFPRGQQIQMNYYVTKLSDYE